jgi:hypothetical protein
MSNSRFGSMITPSRSRWRISGFYANKSPTRMRDEPIEEDAAGFELRDGNVLVGLVRLLDRARADHHHGDAGQGIQSRLGTIGDFAVLVAVGERLREPDDIGNGWRLEAGPVRLGLERDARRSRQRSWPQPRQPQTLRCYRSPGFTLEVLSPVPACHLLGCDSAVSPITTLPTGRVHTP